MAKIATEYRFINIKNLFSSLRAILANSVSDGKHIFPPDTMVRLSKIDKEDIDVDVFPPHFILYYLLYYKYKLSVTNLLLQNPDR